VDLPGPACWWPISYNIDNYGWVGTLDQHKAAAALAYVAPKRKFSSLSDIPEVAYLLKQSGDELILL